MTNTAYEATNSDVEKLIADMKEAAQKATPGQWQAFIDKASSTYSVFAKKIDDVISWMGFDGRKNAGNNAKFIAKANPENVLALISALEQAQQENKSQLAALTNTVELWNEQRTRIAELEAGTQRLAPHLYRECVNELTTDAKKYANAGQLRERLSYILGKYIEADHPHTRSAGCTVEGSE